MRKSHRHQCSDCHTWFVCTAPIEQHGDASWEWHCLLYGQDEIKLCYSCAERSADAAKAANYDGPPDGDAWSGGFARNH